MASKSQQIRILLIAYDNGAYIHMFPQGLAYIAAALCKAKFEVSIYNQDLHHYPEEQLTNYLNKNKFDVIGLGITGGYYQYQKLIKISEAINKSKNRPFYIIGGHGPSPEPEYFIKKSQADAVVIGEGDETVVELVKCIGNKKPLSNVKGIAFRDGDRVIVNERRPLIQNLNSIPFPAYDLFPMEYYRLYRVPKMGNSDFTAQMISGRGCVFKCNFCYRMDEGFRPRTAESIVEEICLLKRDYGITFVEFYDELLMSSVERTIKLCEFFIKAKLGVKWSCNGRLNFAKPQVLKIMKEAGCVLVSYGVEALDDIVLKNMNKALTVEQVLSGAEATRQAGLSADFFFMFGNIGDDERVLNKGVDFILKYANDVSLRTIRPVTPYPGTQLYYYAIEKGLLKGVEDFYDHKHLNSDLISVNFTNLSDKEFYNCLLQANAVLLEDHFRKQYARLLEQTKKLYLNRDSDFRGYRNT